MRLLTLLRTKKRSDSIPPAVDETRGALQDDDLDARPGFWTIPVKAKQETMAWTRRESEGSFVWV